MKVLTNKKFVFKLIVSIICVLLFNFCISPNVQAAGTSFGGKMMTWLRDFTTGLADVFGSVVQFGMTGELHSATAGKGTGTPENQEEYWITVDEFEYPLLQISPEVIFAGEIELLDANFISSSDNESYLLELKDDSGLKVLREVIASWYVTLRTISTVALLSVLVYIGIRIIISSTAQDKSKYKKMILDWIVALCLLFFMHYIMAAANTVIDRVSDTLAQSTGIDNGIELLDKYGGVKYTQNEYQGGDATPGGSFSPVLEANAEEEAHKEMLKRIKEIEHVDDNQIQYSDWSNSTEVPTSIGGMAFYKTRTYTVNEHIVYTLRKDSYKSSFGGSGSTQFSWTRVDNITVQPGNSVVGGTDKVRYSADAKKVLYFTNFARMYLNVRSDDEYIPMSVAYLIIYISLITFTCIFVFRYIKRVIYLAFLTLMAPVVAITYPIDKLKDGKAQAWDMWFKEYVFNLMIQPFHLLLYTVLVSTAMQLAQESIVYAVIAIYFVIPAEKLLRRFFGFDKAETLSAAGSFAGGAMFSALINKMNRPKPEDKDEEKEKTRRPSARGVVNADQVLLSGPAVTRERSTKFFKWRNRYWSYWY